MKLEHQMRKSKDSKEDNEGPGFKTEPLIERLAKRMAVKVAALAVVAASCTYEPHINGIQEPDGGTTSDGGSDGGSMDAGGDGGSGGDGGTMSDGGSTSDGGSDGGMGGCPVASTGTFNGTINEPTPETVGGYVFDFVTENGGGDAVFDISCGGMAVSTNLACPENVETVVLDIPSNKRIRITPNAVNPLAVQVSITVENI
jgi:hypothetical protein